MATLRLFTLSKTKRFTLPTFEIPVVFLKRASILKYLVHSKAKAPNKIKTQFLKTG